jgi:signal transduction histidine kinase
MVTLITVAPNDTAALFQKAPLPAQPILDALAQQVAVLDAGGVIVTVNTAWNLFARANGGDPQSVGVGRNYLQICSAAAGRNAEEASAAFAGIQAVLEGSSPYFELEYPCHAPDQQRWFLMQVTPLAAPQGGAVVAHLDISARCRAEYQLRRLNDELQQTVADQTSHLRRLNQQLLHDIERREATEQTLHHMLATIQVQTEALRRSNTDLQQFASLVAHELKEPLRMVSGFLELLQRRFGAQCDPEAAEFITYALDGSRRMRQLIAGLLGLSRLEQPMPTLIDLNEVRDLVLCQDRRLIEEHNAVVTSDLLPILYADTIHMQILFQNLIRNAIKFSGVEPPRIHIGAERVPEGWKLSVRDNGIGIAPEDCGRIFHMFERVHSRQQYEGNGIGLALCARVALRHGGRIWVESQPGEGSTFFVSLPERRPEDCRQPPDTGTE